MATILEKLSSRISPNEYEEFQEWCDDNEFTDDDTISEDVDIDPNESIIYEYSPSIFDIIYKMLHPSTSKCPNNTALRPTLSQQSSILINKQNNENKTAKRFLRGMDFRAPPSSIQRCLAQYFRDSHQKYSKLMYLNMFSIRNTLDLAQILIDIYHQYLLNYFGKSHYLLISGYLRRYICMMSNLHLLISVISPWYNISDIQLTTSCADLRDIFFRDCILFNELKNLNKNKFVDNMILYIHEYTQNIFKPISLLINRYSTKALDDNINYYLQYITSVNYASHSIQLRPIQIDLYLIPLQNKNIKLKFDGQNPITSSSSTRAPGTAICDDIYRIIRRVVVHKLHLDSRSRIIIIIQRKNSLHTHHDIANIFVPRQKLNKILYSSSELSWITNTNGYILKNLNGNDQNIFNLSIHLHPQSGSSGSKIYISCNQFGSRVFKKDILNVLNILSGSETKTIINKQTINQFNENYQDYNDKMYEYFQKNFLKLKS